MAKKQAPAPRPQPPTTHTKPPKTDTASAHHSYWKALLLCVAWTLVLYLPALNNGFVNWDDPGYVTNNFMIRSLGVDNIRRMFSEVVLANYHPLTMLSYAFNYAFGGENAWGYHALNVLLHAANTGLVFVLVYRLSQGRLLAALLVALLFGVHPMHVESVAWVSERKDVLYVLFYVGAMLTYWQYGVSGSKRYLGFTALLFVAALLSKPSAVTLPIALLLLDFWSGRSWRNRGVWLEKLPFFALSLLFGIVTVMAQSPKAIAELDNYSLFQKIMFGGYGFAYYIAQLLLPNNLAALHPYPTFVKNASLPPIYLVATIAALAFLTATYWAYRKGDKIVPFGMAFYGLQIILVLQFVTVGKAVVAERYSYLSYIGLFFIIGMWLAQYVAKNPQRQTLVWAGVLLWAAVLSALSWQQIGVWKNPETLWTKTLSAHPNCDVAYDNRGIYYRQQKQNDKAFSDFNNVLKINPSYALTYNNRGNIYFEQQKDELALADYNKALNLDSTLTEALVNRAVIKVRNQQIADGMRDFALAQQHNREFPNLYLNRGIAYTMQNQHQAAYDDFTAYLALKPDNDGIYNSRAISLQNLNRHTEAIADFNQAIRLAPKQGLYYLNRSYSYNAIGDRAMAKQDALKAQSLGAKVPANYLQ